MPAKRTTRSRAAAKPAVEAERPEPAYDRPEYEFRPPSLSGCMMPIMFASMLGLIVFLVWDRRHPPAPVDVLPVPAPVVDLRSYTAEIDAKLATDRQKAGVVADAFRGFADALAGPSGNRVTNSGTMETVVKAVLTDLDTRAGVPIGEEVDSAVGRYLGMTRGTDGWDPKQFDDSDRRKLIDILGAIARTAEARR